MMRRSILAATFSALGLGATGAMATQSTELTDLFTAQPSAPPQSMRYRSGVIEAWDPVTLTNAVRVGGTLLANLPVLGVAEAASFTIGTTVGIMVVESTWAIVGRFVVPGTDDALDAITLVGQRAFSASVATEESTSSTSFTDLATLGPTVTNVRIPASGKARVTISAQVVADTAPLTAASVGVQVSGDASIAPSSQQSLFLIAETGALNATRVVLFEGLPAGGSCTFTLKYLANGTTMKFAFRDITVETL